MPNTIPLPYLVLLKTPIENVVLQSKRGFRNCPELNYQLSRTRKKNEMLDIWDRKRPKDSWKVLKWFRIYRTSGYSNGTILDMSWKKPRFYFSINGTFGSYLMIELFIDFPILKIWSRIIILGKRPDNHPHQDIGHRCERRDKSGSHCQVGQLSPPTMASIDLLKVREGGEGKPWLN
jgi:hypothetical protein